MKNELRLGNWIECADITYCSNGGKRIVKRVQFQINKRQMLNIYQGQTAFDFIPLNEKWLKKLGGEVIVRKLDGWLTCWFDDDVFIQRTPDDNGLFSIDIEYGHDASNRFTFKYVHTLQNIYFALKNKELTKDANNNITKG